VRASVTKTHESDGLPNSRTVAIARFQRAREDSRAAAESAGVNSRSITAATAPAVAAEFSSPDTPRETPRETPRKASIAAVSYTHLKLPTSP
jgi:hypothetical protein